MAVTTIKTTYALDVQTVQKLEQLARKWGISKSEALRRVIQNAEEARRAESSSQAIHALDRLQSKIGMDSKQAAQWIRRMKTERRGASVKRLK
jgi:hypothetical protein